MSKVKDCPPVFVPVRLRTEYDGLGDEVSAASALFCPPEEDKTQQQFKEECDINTIAKNFGLTGLLPMTGRALSYQEFEDVFDFQSAMNAVREGSAAFMGLPSSVRERFSHDPQRFLEWCDTATVEQFHEIGLTREGFVPKVKEQAKPAE